MKCGIIYKVSNIINGECYIGKTLGSLQKRKNQHIRAVIDEHKRHYKFYNALRKYGVNNFKWEILQDNIPENELDWCETWFIVTYDSVVNGYNTTYGGAVEANLAKGRYIKNRIPWNKGLGIEDERIKNMTAKAQETRKRNDPDHVPVPENKNITHEALYDCIINKQMTRKQAADHIGTTERLIKKWKQEWNIRSPNNGRIKKGQHLSSLTEFRKGQNQYTKFDNLKL